MTSLRHGRPPRIEANETTDTLAAMVRAYVLVPSNKNDSRNGNKSRKSQKVAPASEWTLIFDTETTTDAAQTLRFGAYQLRKRDELIEHGLFYDPQSLTPPETNKLRAVAAARGATLLSREAFIDEVFYDKAYELRATIVGLNLPFDISRIASRHNSARGKMKGGSTFQLSADPRRARVQIRHLNSRSAFIQFAAQPKQRTPRGARKRQITTPIRRGAFVDLRTISAALFSRRFSLKSLAEHLKTPSQKHTTDAHGARLTTAYVEYALQDVQVTWECYRALADKFAEHGLTLTHIGKILSEASLGKAYLRAMGIKPFREMQPDFPCDLIGLVMSTYYGGRSEVRWRRTIKQVLYCDFLSMYPTVCTLMGLWRFVIAKGMKWKETTKATQAFLDRVTLDNLQNSETWLGLQTIVELTPDDDILPLRAKYDGRSPTIGLNRVSSKQPHWYTLADVIASKLLTGRTPVISRSITFEAMEPQDGLRPVHIGGRDGSELDPKLDDFYKKLIDRRSEVRERLGTAPPDLKSSLDAEQQALKTLANSTSYGIYVEFNGSDLDSAEERTCFGPSGVGFPVHTKKSEDPGPFLNPIIATLITGAARLMLAIAETLAGKADLDWAFCDTDSMAFAKPTDMSTADFFARGRQIVEWFAALNPYENPGPLLKIEDANRKGASSTELHPLYALCISSKRYVLFNIDDDGTPIIRKASAHGLGHMLAPYEESEAPSGIPAPSWPLETIGVERWQYDLWFQIIRATMDVHPDEVDLTYHEKLSLPAMSRYAATTPAILRWFKKWNAGKPYRDQVKPFGFLSALHFDPLASSSILQIPGSLARRKREVPKPIAPFNKDPRIAAKNAFDRETGEKVPPAALKTYASVLAQYHLSPETKFLNGRYLDSGRTERRHVFVASIEHIGKEANNWEKQFFLGSQEDEQIEYGVQPGNDLTERVEALCIEFGERAIASKLGIARGTLRKLRREGVERLSAVSIERLWRRIQ